MMEYWNDGMLQVVGLEVCFCSVFGVFEAAGLDCQICLTEDVVIMKF